MKHSEYINLTRALDSLTKGSDTLRALFSKIEVLADPVSLEPGEPTTRWVPTDQARGHPLFPSRFLLLDMATRTVEETARIMDGCVDSWTDTNQARADQGLGPTADTRGLFQAMADFISATDTPTRGIVGLYDPARSRCRAWMNQANTWFPDLNDNLDLGTVLRPTSTTRPGKGGTVTVTIDRGQLARFFNVDFRTPQDGKQYSRFDKFCFATQTANTFTKKDWGRIAYAIKWNHKIITQQVRVMDFTPWLVEFFGAIGLEPPKDTRQNKYKDPKGVKHFIIQWLSA